MKNIDLNDNSTFIKKIFELIDEWSDKAIPDAHKFTPEAEIKAGMDDFKRFLKSKYSIKSINNSNSNS